MEDGRGAVVAFSDIEERLRADEDIRRHDALVATLVMSRFDSDESATVIGAWADRPTPFQAGTIRRRQPADARSGSLAVRIGRLGAVPVAVLEAGLQLARP